MGTIAEVEAVMRLPELREHAVTNWHEEPLHGKKTRVEETDTTPPLPEDATKAEVDHRPTVYGYLRDEEPDEIQIGLWRKEIGLFCEEQSYRLALVFVDRGIPHEQVARTGFTGLLDVLELDDSYGVVVLDVSHISDNNHALALMQRLIRRTASKLIVIHDQADEFKADGA